MLFEKYLVTKVTTCPAYAFYLTSQGTGLHPAQATSSFLFTEDPGLELSLHIQTPPGIKPLSAGPELSTTWVPKGGEGLFRSGDKTDHPYTVLFKLKHCQKLPRGQLRDSTSPVSDSIEG